LLRRFATVRDLVAESSIDVRHLVYPMFVGRGETKPVPNMPDIYVWNVGEVNKEVGRCLALGIKNFIIFGCEEDKDPEGRTSLGKSAAYMSIKNIKGEFGNDVFVIADVCLCGYTTHGHCGILVDGEIDHEKTAKMLGRVAVHYAEGGADMVAPSSMTDHQVIEIRNALDDAGFKKVSIISYSAKYASKMYGPFRDAVHSAPSFGDRKSYQMDFRNIKEAVCEVIQDIEEGADVVMVKPSMWYMDVIHHISEVVDVPVACFNVSGEYSMMRYAIKEGILPEDAIIEFITGLFRAGASIVITYHAVWLANFLKNRT